jgi:DNA-binding MarR family transcriptional regulator
MWPMACDEEVGYMDEFDKISTIRHICDPLGAMLSVNPMLPTFAMSTTKKDAPLRIDATTYVPSLLSMLNNQLASGASDLYLKLFGVGINEWRIITALIKYPGCIAAVVAEKCMIHKGVVSRSLQTLHEKGIVRTEIDSPLRTLYLTDEGIKLHDRIVKIAFKRQDLLLQGLTQAEVHTLLGLLHRLLDNVKATNDYEPAHDGGDLAKQGRVAPKPARTSKGPKSAKDARV